jgi:hypothetical protein
LKITGETDMSTVEIDFKNLAHPTLRESVVRRDGSARAVNRAFAQAINRIRSIPTAALKSA